MRTYYVLCICVHTLCFFTGLFLEKYSVGEHMDTHAVETAYYILTAIMSVLSICGSLLILFYYYKMPQLRNKSRQLLINLTICDLAISIGNFVGIAWYGYVQPFVTYLVQMGVAHPWCAVEEKGNSQQLGSGCKISAGNRLYVETSLCMYYEIEKCQKVAFLVNLRILNM